MRAWSGVVVSLGLAALVAAGVGCGPSLPAVVPVQGVVLMNDAPVEGAAVMLMPQGEGNPAEGVTDAQGKFTVKAFSEGRAGARPGLYKVLVIKKITTGVISEDGLSGAAAPGGVREEWLTPQRYALPESTPFNNVEVKAGMPPLELKLTSP